MLLEEFYFEVIFFCCSENIHFVCSNYFSWLLFHVTLTPPWFLRSTKSTWFFKSISALSQLIYYCLLLPYLFYNLTQRGYHWHPMTYYTSPVLLNAKPRQWSPDASQPSSQGSRGHPQR